jgi:hypothetical protein
MNLPDDFRQWVADPARTVDELCAAEVLLELGEGIWKGQHKQYGTDWDAKARKRKERAGNPAYRPTIKKKLIDQTIEVAPLIKNFSASWHDDRAIRSLEPLRFFKAIEEIGVTLETDDFSALRELPALRRLNFHEQHNGGGHVIKDLAGLAGLKLQTLGVGVRLPWPNLRAIGELPELETLSVRANLLALRDVGPLPKVKSATFEPDFHCNTPVRNFHDLPDMPAVKHMRINSIAGLEGVEKMPELLGLDLVGPFQDLRPLEKLEKLTWLRLEGGWFMDLAPLARMPRLRELVMVRERPLDLSPLSEAPALREVTVERCAILRTELSALNAGFLPWSLDFVAPEPRPLAPLRVFTYKPDHPDVAESRKAKEADPREEFYGDDQHHRAAEARWFAHELQQRLDALLGEGWGDVTSYADRWAGYRHLTIQRFKDILRMEEIVQSTRELMAMCRFPWHIMVSAEPHGDLSKDMEEIRAQREEQERDWLDRDYDAEQEREEYEEFRQTRRELYERLEREHRLRLLQQQGEEINPADFSPDAKPATVPKAAAAEEEDDDFDDDDEGGLDELDEDDPEQSEFEEEMSFVFDLTENSIWVSAHQRETFEATLGIRAEDWHALPEPPAERPQPRLT